MIERFHLARTLSTAVLLALACKSEGDAASDADETTAATDPDASTTTTTASSADVSTDGTTNVADSTGSSSSDTGSAASCEAASTCLPAIDAPWSGPVTLTSTDDCDGYFALKGDFVYDDLLAPPVECSCTCEVAGDPVCATTTNLRHWADDACVGDSADAWNVTATCNPAVSAGAGTAVHAGIVELEGVTCEPVATQEVESAGFETEYRICEHLGEVEACGNGGACIPSSAPDTVCIWRDGDFPCPSEWNDSSEFHYREFIDDRRCTECTCNEFYGTCDGFSVYLFGTDSCNEAPIGGVSSGSCAVLGSQGATAARRTGTGTFDEPDCSGEAVGGTAAGSAGPTSPVTFCCRDL